MTATNQLGEAPIRKLFFQNYGPAIISLLSSIVHQVINGIILGQQIGKDGLAAVGLYGPVVIVLVALSLPVMIGGGVLIGKSIGAGDLRQVQQVFQFATTLVILFGTCVAISAPFSAIPLAQFLAGAANLTLAENTADYAFWQLLGLPFFFLGMIWGNFVRANNAPKVSRNASILAACVNIVLDLILIVGCGLGVKGASIATSIALATGATYLFVYIFKGNTHFSFFSFRFTLKLPQWKEYFKIGLPSFASEIAFSSGLLLINQSLIHFGATAVAAFGLVNYLSFLLIRPFTAAMIAALPIMSFNIGARQPQRVLETLWFSLGFTLLLGIVVTAIGLFLSDQLIVLFSGDQNMAYRKIASQAMSLYFLLFLAAGPNYLLAAFLQSTGKTIISLFINLLKGFLLVAPALLILPDYFGLPGIWLSRSLAEILTFIIIATYTMYYKGRYFSVSAVVPSI
ncbi:polysaccharide biosynthesis C-terminal domain-containing protein [Dyadobacter sp. CY261]|uniref:MATE family efflux transporter n=1 Tax=Dyadobacter sp. CY261 TaxID=2907203 RepID=UPI001EFF2624|nr:MATE family efflux transporter [Dyadobacter sp. CY261]MCF0074294.1 polysaccharide biosynthesis C-terminal domain-containing protein [Dyadobacter sp. CY261]